MAETVYNVIQALSEEELQCLYKMLDKDRHPIVRKVKKKTDWDLEREQMRKKVHELFERKKKQIKSPIK